MRCYHCHRYIRKAYYTQGGKTYGPECGRKLGLDKAAADTSMKYFHNPVTKHKAKGAISNRTLEVQDGQVELFEGLTA